MIIGLTSNEQAALERIGSQGRSIDTEQLQPAWHPITCSVISQGLAKASKMNSRQHFVTLTDLGKRALAQSQE